MARDAVRIGITDNQGYHPDQIEIPITLQDVADAIEDAIREYGPEARAVLSNGQRYGAGYGAFTRGLDRPGALDIRDARELDSEEDH